MEDPPRQHIDFFMECVWQSKNFIRPHVILIYRSGVPDAMLVGRLERAWIDLRVGYFRMARSPIRLISFSYGGPLGASRSENAEAIVRLVMDSLRKGEADAAFFHSLNTDAPLYRNALRLPDALCRDHLLRPLNHDVMQLPVNVELMYRGLSQGLRAEIRRKRKKLLAEYREGVKVRLFRDPAEVVALFPTLEGIARKTYQRALGVRFEDNEQMRTRFRVSAQRGWLRVYLLTVNDRPCAFWTGSLYEGSFCSEEVGFDPEFSHFSPGTFLLSWVIEDLCAAGA